MLPRKSADLSKAIPPQSQTNTIRIQTHTSIRNCGKHARVLHKNKMHDVQTFAYIMPFNVATDRMTENTNEANTIQCGGATTFTFGLGRTNHNERTKRNE